MFISDMLFNMHVRVKVVHSIPGRLRLHVPFAKKIPSEWRIDDVYFDVFKCIHGVTEFEFNYITSNALVKYDPNITDEKKHIIDNLKAMTKLANKHRQKLSTYTLEEKEEAAIWFGNMIESEFESIGRKR